MHIWHGMGKVLVASHAASAFNTGMWLGRSVSTVHVSQNCMGLDRALGDDSVSNCVLSFPALNG